MKRITNFAKNVLWLPMFFMAMFMTAQSAQANSLTLALQNSDLDGKVNLYGLRVGKSLTAFELQQNMWIDAEFGFNYFGYRKVDSDNKFIAFGLYGVAKPTISFDQMVSVYGKLGGGLGMVYHHTGSDSSDDDSSNAFQLVFGFGADVAISQEASIGLDFTRYGLDHKRGVPYISSFGVTFNYQL